MAITTGNATNGIAIAATDTTILTAATATRVSITFASFHEQTGVAETVELFVSTDSSSAAGERLDKLIFAANETIQPVSALIALPAGSFLIGKATTGAVVECNLQFTLYTGSSV